jgi:hypothetical protein
MATVTVTVRENRQKALATSTEARPGSYVRGADGAVVPV